MSIKRWAAARDENEPEIVKALRNVGAHVELLAGPVDLLVGYARQWFLLEVKVPKGRTTPAQDEFFKASDGKGGIATVVRNASEALAVIGCETRGVEVGPRFNTQTSPWLDGTGGGQ